MGNVANLFWDNDNKVWRKALCNAEGKLIIDPSEIFENDPTDDEHGKAPDSDWAYEHENNASAHHAKYTDAEARAAIGDLLDSTGKLLKIFDWNYFAQINCPRIYLKNNVDSTTTVRILSLNNSSILDVVCYLAGTGYVATYIDVYDGTAYRRLATEPVVDTKIADHAADDDAHHAKYTDAEAQAAVGWNGTRYWSCPGVHFDPTEPDVDDITKATHGGIVANADGITFVAQVHLPHGAVITSAKVTGNAAAEDEEWYLTRKTLSDGATTLMAGANIGTADTDIGSATVDNSAYAYFIYTTSLDTNDIIHGATITFTV